MIVCASGRRVAVCVVALAAAGCASTSRNSFVPYTMLPAADLTARAADLEPAVGLDAPAPGQTVPEWTADWIDGPVSSIATAEEFDRYARLDNDLERREFIRLFWQRRNPEPERAYNESLLEFNRRVAVANDQFSTSDQPGWRTAFGRTLLTLGFPTIVRIGDREGPRAVSTEPVAAEHGDRVFWQFGLRPEDLSTPLAAVRWRGTGSGQLGAAYSVAFSFYGGGWGIGCRPGWLADSLGDVWIGMFNAVERPMEGTSGTGYLQQGPSTDAGVGEAESPIAGSGGVYMSVPSVGSGFARSGFIGGYRFGAGCGDVFDAARANWLYNTVYYP